MPASIQNTSSLDEHQNLEGTHKDTIQCHNGTNNLLQRDQFQHTALVSKSTSGTNSFQKCVMNASPNSKMEEIEVSTTALQKQIKTMYSNLDEMYAKAKQELEDLERHVICAVRVRSSIQIEAPLCTNCRKASRRKAWPS